MISVDTDYSLWINGQWVDAGHYDDYPADRTHDTLDVAEYLKAGVNRIAVQGYYQGHATSQYSAGKPGVIYALYAKDEVLAVSGGDTLCRVDPVYACGSNPLITGQLGFAFDADGRSEDGWREVDYVISGWQKAEIKSGDLYSRTTKPRPVEKLVKRPRVNAEIVAQGQFMRKKPLEPTVARRIHTDFLSPLLPQDLFASGIITLPFSTEIFMGREPISIITDAWEGSDGFYMVLDMGREEAGLFELDMEAPEGLEVEIGWGQHLEDLRVRTDIDSNKHFTLHCWADSRTRSYPGGRDREDVPKGMPCAYQR